MLCYISQMPLSPPLRDLTSIYLIDCGQSSQTVRRRRRDKTMLRLLIQFQIKSMSITFYEFINFLEIISLSVSCCHHEGKGRISNQPKKYPCSNFTLNAPFFPSSSSFSSSYTCFSLYGGFYDISVQIIANFLLLQFRTPQLYNDYDTTLKKFECNFVSANIPFFVVLVKILFVRCIQ